VSLHITVPAVSRCRGAN